MSDKPEEKISSTTGGGPENLQTFYCQVRDRNDPSKIVVLTLQAADLQEVVSKLQHDGYLLISIQTNPPKSDAGIFSFPWLKKINKAHPFGTASSQEGSQTKAASSGAQQAG